MLIPSKPDGARRPPVALIAGPTASGKSALAVALAQSLIAAGRDAIVINADASQVYADLPILSAQPSAAERGGVPHLLFGHIDAGEAYNAARWADEARTAIAAAHEVGAIPILVGGSGLYIRTLLDGIAPVPEIDATIRASVRAMTVSQAHAALTIADPAAASRLNPADRTRVARALEVVMSSGTPLSDWQRAVAGGIGTGIALTPLMLLPPRDWLRARCNARFAAMLDAGALREVRTLLARQLNPDLPAMRAIGVSDLSSFLAGAIDRDTAIAQATAATRQYAKRQYSWFRNQAPSNWPQHIAQLDGVEISKIAIILRQKLLT